MEGITPERAIDLMKENKKLIIIDIRSFIEYSKCHINNSINVCIPSTLIKRSSFNISKIESIVTCNMSKQKLKEREGHDMIVYDLDCDCQKNTTFQTLIKKFYEEGVLNSVSYIKGGFSALYQKFPNYCSVVQETKCSEKFDSFSFCDYQSDMDQVNEYLYIGSQLSACNKEKILKNGITHVLNCAKELPNYFEKEDTFKYLKIALSDCPSQTLDKIYLDETVHFINEAKKNGGKVLIHCFAGQSRSATILIAYLMISNQMTFSESYSFLKQKRECVSPNLGFISQLTSLENRIFGSQNKNFASPSLCRLSPVIGKARNLSSKNRTVTCE